MEAAGERRRAGWGSVAALALAALLLWIFEPLPLFALILAALCLLSPRRPLVALGAVVIGVALAGAEGGTGETTLLWGTLIAAVFAAAAWRWPERGLLSHALTATAASFAAAAAWFAATGMWHGFDAAMRGRFRAAAALWQAQIAAGPNAWPEELRLAVERGAAAQGELYPALAGLQSLAILALAWLVWTRLRRGGDESAAPRFRELRFADGWVWVVITGFLLILLPLPAGATRAGANTLLFMGGLYALRGFAVIGYLATGAPTALKVVFGGVAALFFTPIALAGAALVGLGDTWWDVRRRAEQAPPA